MQRKIKICLMWHNLNSANYGVGALAISHLNMVVKMAEENGLLVEIETLGTPSSNGLEIQADIENRLGIKIVHKVFTFRLIATSLMTFQWSKINFLRNTQYDYVFDIGEGDSFSDIYGLKRFFVFCLSKWLVLKEKVPLILAPQTIGPFKYGFSSKMAAYLMKKSQAIYVRDHKSSDYLKKMNISYTEVSDVAFVLPFDPMPVLEDSVGINVSALLWHGGYTKNNQFNLGVDYQKLVIEIVKLFIKRGKNVHLIAHVISDSIEVEDDYRIANVVKNNFFSDDIKVTVAPKFKSPIEAKSYISQMRFFLGSRMHATIGALSSGVPTIPLAYSRKFSGVFGSIDYPYTIDLYGKQCDETVLVTLFNYYDHQYDEIASQGKKSIVMAKNKLNTYREFLKDLLK